MTFEHFTHVSFDCYGTLIDWERGILDSVGGVLKKRGIAYTDKELLEIYVSAESKYESGSYKSYREVLDLVMTDIAAHYSFKPEGNECYVLSESVGLWQPFSDTVHFLKKIKEKYKLVIISNVDDDIFKKTNALLKVKFDNVITAQQVKSYKPSLLNFEFALQKIGIGKDKLLHVAQSLYHDHVPANALGISSIWVKRPSVLGDQGLALPVDVKPELVVGSLEELERKLGM